MNDQPTTLRTILANAEVDSVFSSVRKAIEQQRRRILDTQLDFTTRRANLVDQLTDLDAEYAARMPELERQLARLEALRG